MRIIAVLLVTTGLQVYSQDRMSPIPADKQTAAQKKAVQDYKDLRKADLAGPPWTVILRVPDLVVPSLELRLHNQKNSALSPKLTEFAILIAAREWTNNFEWNAHSTLAARAGLSQDIMAAVADGRIRPVIDRVFAFEEAREAFHFFMEGQLFGKVVIMGATA